MDVLTAPAEVHCLGYHERCPYPVRADSLCAAHNMRYQRNQDIDVPIKARIAVGPCGVCEVNPIYSAGKCKTCYRRAWTAQRKVAKSDPDWFDWVMVKRAWDGEVLPRQLTNPERLHLIWQGVKEGLRGNAAGLARLAHLTPDVALSLAESVATGEVRVMGRDWLGKPTEWLSVPA